jgi:hypothetical protein
MEKMSAISLNCRFSQVDSHSGSADGKIRHKAEVQTKQPERLVSESKRTKDNNDAG